MIKCLLVQNVICFADFNHFCMLYNARFLWYKVHRWIGIYNSWENFYISVQLIFKSGGRRAWFLKIDPVRIVGMRVRMSVCVCVHAQGY